MSEKDMKQLLSAAVATRPDALQHVLISAKDVREKLRSARQGWTKHRFDSTALALARAQVITLHHHDHPQGLRPADRAKLIADDRGTHYIGFVIEAEAPRTAELLATERRSGSAAPRARAQKAANRARSESSPPWLKGLRKACEKIASEFGEACPTDDLAPVRSFAEEVKRSLGRIPARKKVEGDLYFIGDAWRAFNLRKKEKLSLPRFKEAVVAAYRKDLLRLAKADMPQFYKADRLDESETIDRGTYLHFVREEVR